MSYDVRQIASTGGDDDDASAMPLRESSAVNAQLKRSNTGSMEQMLTDENQDMFDDTNMVEEDVLMDGFVPPKTAMYCMFPDEQELVSTKWDDWGAMIDVSDLRTLEGEVVVMKDCSNVSSCQQSVSLLARQETCPPVS